MSERSVAERVFEPIFYPCRDTFESFMEVAAFINILYHKNPIEHAISIYKNLSLPVTTQKVINCSI